MKNRLFEKVLSAFLAIAIIVLSVLLGVTASLLYITVISPVKRKKTAEGLPEKAAYG